MKYRYVNDLTSDIAFIGYGSTYKEVFENTAMALSEVICKTKKIKPINKKVIIAKADDYEGLLFNFLSEIIAAVDIEEMFFSKFKITKLNSKEITAECFGQEMTPKLGNTVVKAVTKHKFGLKKTKGRIESFVTVDI